MKRSNDDNTIVVFNTVDDNNIPVIVVSTDLMYDDRYVVFVITDNCSDVMFKYYLNNAQDIAMKIDKRMNYIMMEGVFRYDNDIYMMSNRDIKKIVDDLRLTVQYRDEADFIIFRCRTSI